MTDTHMFDLYDDRCSLFVERVYNVRPLLYILSCDMVLRWGCLLLTVHKYTLNELCDLGWSHGFVFGKYTKQIMLDDDLLSVLDNSQESIDCYMKAFNAGYKAGSAETVRSRDPISGDL